MLLHCTHFYLIFGLAYPVSIAKAPMGRIEASEESVKKQAILSLVRQALDKTNCCMISIDHKRWPAGPSKMVVQHTRDLRIGSKMVCCHTPRLSDFCPFAECMNWSIPSWID